MRSPNPAQCGDLPKVTQPPPPIRTPSSLSPGAGVCREPAWGEQCLEERLRPWVGRGFYFGAGERSGTSGGFLFGDYPERHRPTDGPRLYRPAVLLDGAVYDLSIRDGDVADPGSSPGGSEEWPDPKDWSLQDTDAFVLVYDICSPDSFDYVKALRQRIAETRPAGAPEAPILVVGNKRDRQRLRFGPRRALAALVRRGWRCGYLECSAKYNWHVLRLFRELLRCALVRARPAHPALRLQGALHPARCSLM
ncbi:ras-like protein family member 10A isoform X1 [Cebus imitator]|uniref:ras-like protein family member 10A isoform X1 n=1 Tax=Cebus imitator TaxID=2715852 RepID=UPI00189A5638|nr:ras-like protein family member 10A isoform X1 [Cebus imitator]